MTKWTPTKDSRIKKRDGVYWARFMKKGKRVEISLETKSFEIAKASVEKIEGQLLIGRSWKQERQLFEDAWLEFLTDKSKGNKVRAARESTLHEYAKAGVKYYVPFFGRMRLSDIDEHAWAEFVEWASKESPGIRFFNLRKYFSGFLTWAKRHGKILTPPYLFNPDAKRDMDREEYSPGKAYSKEELRDLRVAAAQYDRFYLFMLMAQYMGMRPGEINQLNLERINLKDNVIELKRADTKTSLARIVPIHPLVRPLLEEQMEHAKGLGSDYLFPHAHVKAKPNAPMDRQGFKKVWARVMAAAGVSGRVYDFRHTFITHAIAGGMNPAAVAMITGTSIKMIQKYYLHLGPNELSKAIAEFKL